MPRFRWTWKGTPQDGWTSLNRPPLVYINPARLDNVSTQYAAASTHHMGVYPQDASYLLGPLTREPYQRRHIDSLQHNLDSQFAQPFPKYPQLVNEQAISHTHPSEISRQGSHKAECVFLSRTTGSDVLELLVRKYCFDLRRSLSWTSY